MVKMSADTLLLHAEAFLQEALPFHHWHAPVALAVHDFARLEAVAEGAQGARGGHSVGHVRQAVEAAGGGAREHRLADALGEALAQAVAVHGEQQRRDAGARVGRFVGRELALDRRFALAGDDRGGKAGELQRRRTGPLHRPRGDHHARRAHAEGLGKSVFDENAAYLHAATISYVRTWGPASAGPALAATA